MTDAPVLCVDFEAEAAALSAALANDSALELVLVGLEPDDFYREDHRLIHAAMWKLAAADSPIDAVTLRSALPTKRRAELGDYLHTLAEANVIAANVRAYIAAVKDASHRRRLSLAAQAAQADLARANGEGIRLFRERLTQVLEAEGKAEATAIAPQTHTGLEFATLAAETPDYIVWGYVARGSITEITAQIKAGKTRFALDLCASVVSGRDFLGHAVERCPVLYLTEERVPTFRGAIARVGLDHESDFHILTRNEVRGLTWEQIGQFAANFCDAHKIGLVAVDTLSDWAGMAQDAEKDAGAAMAAMAPLQAIAVQHVGIVTCRHERKGGGELGESARGSSAFGGAVDVLVGLRRRIGTGNEHQRELKAVGRFDDTPEDVVIELDGHGRYVSLGTAGDVQAQTTKAAVLAALPTSRHAALTREQLHDEMPDEIHSTTCNEVLARLLTDGIIGREKGIGQASNRAFGYWLKTDDDEVLL